MTSDAVKKLLEELRAQGKFDEDFLNILSDANASGKAGKATALEVLKLIKKRYAESKETST